jgi:hypothetical protein
MTRRVHVLPCAGGGWRVLRENADRETSVHRTKRAARDAARALADHEGVQLVVHRRDGSVEGRGLEADPPPRESEGAGSSPAPANWSDADLST